MISVKNIGPESVYASFRAENKSPRVVVLNIWRYLLKYFLKKRKYSEEDMIWSEGVRSVCNRLMISGKESLRGHEKVPLTIGLAGDIMWVRKGDENMISAGLREKMQKSD